MRGLCFERVLASTAIALLLTTAAGAAIAAPEISDAVEAAIPVPEPAKVPPPTAQDVKPVPAEPAPVNGTAAGPASPATEDAAAPSSPAPAAHDVATPSPATPAVNDAAPAATHDVAMPATPAAPAPSKENEAAAPAPATPSAAAHEQATPPTSATQDAAAPAAAPAAKEAATATSPAPAGNEVAAPAAPASATHDVASPAVPTAPAASPAKAAETAPSSPAAAATPAAAAGQPKQAADQQSQPKPATGLAAEDQAVADQLQDMLSGKIDRLFARKNERSAVEAFYRDRHYAPVWIEKGAQSPRAAAAIGYLKGVDAVGLDPAEYPAPDFAAATSPRSLADAELKLTASVLTYARQAQTGRMHFSRVSPDIFYKLEVPEPADILANMASTKDVAEALDGYNPPQPGFKALKEKLAEIRAQKGESHRPPPIARGRLLKIGMRDPRVPQLRKRLGVAGDAADTTYDKELSDAVQAFQRQHDLSTNGHLNSSTIAALNGPPRRDREADIIIANMERWRWMPRDLGKAYVMVNLPDYALKVVDNGKTVWHTKIVIGKPGKATPLLTETMKFITVNPTWNVPPSIVENEYLPALQQDPEALDRIGLKVVQNPDGTIHIYQPPGDRNALGRIRFNFPNKFLVYQHDTPDKYLFAKTKRAYSHGCMRVQDPLKYAEVLLSISNPNDGYTVERLHRMYGSEERNINLRTPIPVHLTYQTAFVDDAGKLQFREDVYGRDSRILAILRGEDPRVAEIPVEHRPQTITRFPVAPRLPTMRRVESAGDFFFGLFR